MRFRCLSAALLMTTMWCGPVSGQLIREHPEIQDLETVEQRGEQIPRDLAFRNSDGTTVTLGTFLDGEMPVLLSLNYTRCPQLCGIQINGIIDGLRELSYQPGVDYRYLSVSIDPLESYQTAATQRSNFVKAVGKPVEGNGIDFLTGSPEAIRDLAQAVGFKYRYLKDKKQYVHPPVLISLTPDGVISRYFYSVKFDGQTLRLSLGEASDGRISSVFDQIIMTCFQYNSSEGRYTLAAWGAMRLGGVITLLVMAAFLLPVWIRAIRNSGTADSASADRPVTDADLAPVPETDLDGELGSSTISTEKVES